MCVQVHMCLCARVCVCMCVLKQLIRACACGVHSADSVGREEGVEQCSLQNFDSVCVWVARWSSKH